MKDFFLGTPRRKTLTLFSAVAVIYVLLTLIYIGPAIFKGYPYIVSYGPSDATAGLTWMESVDKGGVRPDLITYLTNYPYGDTLRDPFQITSLFNIGGMWLFGHLFSAVEAWNIMVLIGYVFSAAAMFAFIRWLLRNNWVAFFAGVAVTFTPYHQANALCHLSYMFSGFFILVVWAFLAFWRNPTFKKASLLAVATGACLYTDGYFNLLAGVLLVALIVGSLGIDLLFFRRNRQYMWPRLRGLLLFGGLGIALALPLGLTQLHSKAQIASTLAASRGTTDGDVETYSARLSEYVLPGAQNSWTPQSFRTQQLNNQHGSNGSENNLYIGISVLFLAASTWFFVWGKQTRKSKNETLPYPFVVGVFMAVMMIAYLFSLEPTVHLFGRVWHMPSWYISHFSASWRVYARLALIVDLTAVILASLGLLKLTQRLGRIWRPVVICLVTLIVMGDMLTSYRAVNWNYLSYSAVYPWLKTQTNVKVIAEYPIVEPPSSAASYYLTFQTVHGKALVNTSRADSPQKALQQSIAGLNDAQTVPVLRTLGAQVVLSHGTPASTEDLTFVRKDSSTRGDIWTYRLVPGPKAAFALTADSGFNAPVITDEHSTVGMTSSGEMQIVALANAKNGTVQASFIASSVSGETRAITVKQGSNVLWHGDISGQDTPVNFNAITGQPLKISVDGAVAATQSLITIHDMRAHAN